jgi:hypothetical protein
VAVAAGAELNNIVETLVRKQERNAVLAKAEVRSVGMILVVSAGYIAEHPGVATIVLIPSPGNQTIEPGPRSIKQRFERPNHLNKSSISGSPELSI